MLSKIAHMEIAPTTQFILRLVKHLVLDYCTTNPNTSIRYHPPNMMLKGHSDASFFSKPKAFNVYIDIQHHIIMERHGLKMEERISSKRKISHKFQHIIDWSAFRLAFKNLDTLGRINVAKVVHNLWPTMSVLKDRKMGVTGMCPRCNRSQETVQHVYRCTSQNAQSGF